MIEVEQNGCFDIGLAMITIHSDLISTIPLFCK